ncbi:MAG: hypothetical protein KH420_10005, partial [Clostridiales bacterium]|nr:hypothetical protein [Clostridiales bacterium]
GYDAAARQGGENADQTVREDAPKAYAGKSLSSDSGVYRYDFLTALPDMRVTGLPEVTAVRDAAGKVDTGAVVDAGMKNARAVGTVRDGKVFVRNTYTGKQLRIDRTGIRHGLNGPPNRLLTNARLGAVIGDVVQNAVPVNALHNKAEGVSGTYAMAAYATDSRGREFVAIITVEQRSGNVTDLEAYDVLHAASGRQKKASPADTRSQGVYPSTAGTISIEDFLGVVNATHQSILSDDVLQHLGQSRNPGGYYTGQVKFALKAPAEEAADPRSESGLVWAGSDTSPTRLRRATSPQGEAAQTGGQSENADQAGDDVRYSIRQSFRAEIQEWYEEGQPEGERFVLGSTGPVLQGLGAIESDLYINGDKISLILQQHPEITIREIQRIPEVLEDPVLVLKSRNAGRGGRRNTRLVLFGTLRAENGQPVMAVLDLRPVEGGLTIDDMQKVNSAYTRNNAANYVWNSEVLYADEKRTIPLLRSFEAKENQSSSSSDRLAHTGSERLLRSGYMGSISYSGKNVNLNGVPFSSVVEAFRPRVVRTNSDSGLVWAGSERKMADDGRFSIKYDQDNRPYVLVDTDI